MPAFNHITLNVSNLKGSSAFYEHILGLKRIDEPFKEGKHVWLHLGEHCQLHLVEEKNVPEQESKNWHFAFAVPDLNAFIQKLEEASIAYGGLGDASKKINLRPDGIRQIYFQDPDGYWIEANDDRY